MTQQNINLGIVANDGTGDDLRTAMTKIQANFTDVYNKVGLSKDPNPTLSANLDLHGYSITDTLTNQIKLGTSSISLLGSTLTLPVVNDALVARNTTDTLTNKTIDAGSSTNYITATSGTTVTLTNPDNYTIGTPITTGGISTAGGLSPYTTYYVAASTGIFAGVGGSPSTTVTLAATPGGSAITFTAASYSSNNLIIVNPLIAGASINYITATIAGTAVTLASAVSYAAGTPIATLNISTAGGLLPYTTYYVAADTGSYISFGTPPSTTVTLSRTRSGPAITFTASVYSSNNVVIITPSIPGNNILQINNKNITGFSGSGGTVVLENNAVINNPTIVNGNYDGLNIDASASTGGANLNISADVTLDFKDSATFQGGTAITVDFGNGGTVLYTGGSTTGTGGLVYNTSPTFATSIDGSATFSAFASSTLLTIGSNNTNTITTTNGTTVTLGTAASYAKNTRIITNPNFSTTNGFAANAVYYVASATTNSTTVTLALTYNGSANNFGTQSYSSNNSVTIGSSSNVKFSNNVTLNGILSTPQQTQTSTSPGTPGQISWDSGYIYVCTATNTWKRVALTGGVF